MKSAVYVALLSALASLAQAEDVLYSKRSLQKRGLDEQGNYNISFFHINDVHAHLDEFSSSGTDCTRPERGCYGGYARVKHVIDEQRPNYDDSLFLNMGDEFQGTLFYTYYKGEKIAETLNELGFDAMTLGNHEFDDGDDNLGAFLQNLTFPIVSANIQSDHPVLNATIKPYHIFEDKQLAVIGVTTETTPNIASPGPGTTFSDAVEAVQNTVDLIRSTTNITRIAAMTHIGYEQDQRLAEETTGLFLIMGGHSHTPLGAFEGAEGPYPTIKTNRDGDEVFIVTAYRWGEYLGYIDVTYAPDGKILAYHGGPIHLTNTTTQDEDLQAQIESWRGPFEEFAAEELGISDVVLEQSNCRASECLLGDFMADAMLAYRANSSAPPESAGTLAIINGGGIRATIDAGPVTRGEVLTSFPFGNSLVELSMSGSALRDALEGIVSGVSVTNGQPVTSFLQISGNARVEYNPGARNGSKLVRAAINGSDVDQTKQYTIVTLDFLAGGGDNFFSPTTDFATLDTQDEILAAYVQAQSPINISLDGRIRTVNGTAPTDGTPTPTITGSESEATDATGTAGRIGARRAGTAALVAGSVGGALGVF